MKRLLKNLVLHGFFVSFVLVAGNAYSSETRFPFVFHLVQVSLWEESLESGSIYYPPTYEQDGFTHGTSNPNKLLNVANHFLQDRVEQYWAQWVSLLCPSVDSKLLAEPVQFDTSNLRVI